MDATKRIYRITGILQVFCGASLAVFVVSDIANGRGLTVVTPFAILFLVTGPLTLYKSRN